ncbi:MAG: cytochrome c oxidase assembly protein [Gammaproteobacteria bacterium RIFCSPHIGHO2_12_FULL_45_12]|nr:MAG: cytochrome c oxidase assembly protein [Gammaproteobacteria bacterium RIFCSPHIGHO2_12_FULL_45_12]
MSEQRSHKKVIIIGGAAAAVMFMFCFAIVPVYSVICRATGINTSAPDTSLITPAELAAMKKPEDVTRNIKVQFVAVNNMGLPWEFYPRVNTVIVHPGKNAKVYFHAKNTTSKPMTVQAIPSMTPSESLGHFHKIECFCFRQQTLQGHESKEMPLVFQVDSDLPKSVRTITLAYTLFDVTPKATRKQS